MDFTHQHYLVIRALADGIFPPTIDAPTASDLPVAEMFISIAQSWEPEVLWATMNALDAVTNISVSIFGAPPQNLDWSALDVLIGILSINEDLENFWKPFRMLITLSYYSLPPAYLAIGLPGPSIDRGGFTPEGYPA